MGSNALLMSSLIRSGSAVGGSITQANAQRSQAAFTTSQANVNTTLAEIQASDAVQRGDLQAQEKAIQDKRMLGAQRASMGAQGVAVGSGSAADIQKGTLNMSELDQLTIRNNASREAFGYKMQGLNYQGQAKMAALAAQENSKNTILTGGMNAVADLGKGYGDYMKVDAPKTNPSASSGLTNKLLASSGDDEDDS